MRVRFRAGKTVVNVPLFAQLIQTLREFMSGSKFTLLIATVTEALVSSIQGHQYTIILHKVHDGLTIDLHIKYI